MSVLNLPADANGIVVAFICSCVLLFIGALSLIFGQTKRGPFAVRLDVAKKQIEGPVKWSLGATVVLLLMINVAASAVAASKFPEVTPPPPPPPPPPPLKHDDESLVAKKLQALIDVIGDLGKSGGKLPNDLVSAFQKWLDSVHSTEELASGSAVATDTSQGYCYGTSCCLAENLAPRLRCMQKGRVLDAVALSKEIRFEHGKASLGKPGTQIERDQLRQLRRQLEPYLYDQDRASFKRVVVVGSHDVSGLDQENWRLAQQRAELVRIAILELAQTKKGYSETSVTAVGSDNWILRESYLHQFDSDKEMVTDQEKLNRETLKRKLAEYWMEVPEGDAYKKLILEPTKIMTQQTLLASGDNRLSPEEVKAYRWLLEHDGHERAQRWYDGRVECTPSATGEGYEQPQCPEGELTDPATITKETNRSKERWAGFRTVVLIRLL